MQRSPCTKFAGGSRPIQRHEQGAILFHSPCLLYVIVLVHVGCNGVIVVVVVVDMCSDGIDVIVVAVAIVVVGRSTSVVVCLPWPSVCLSPP